MPDEKPETNVEGAEITPKAETTPETEQEVDWKAKIGELEASIKGLKERDAKVETLIANYQANQRNLSAAEKRGSPPEVIKGFEAKMATIDEKIELLMDAQAGVELDPARRAQIVQRQEDEHQKRLAEQATNDFYSAVEEAGFTRDDPRVKSIREESVTPTEGLRRLISLTKQIEKEAQTKAQTAIEEAKAKAIIKEREAKEKTGELTMEAGGTKKGVVKGLTIEDVRKMTPAEQLANIKEIAKLPLMI